MLRILGSARQLCQGMTRRDMLRVGGLGLAGLSLPQVLALQEASAGDGKDHGRAFGKAKAVILIHLYGSPSQLEWVDCKPEAPAEIRGELGVIPSSLPGCPVCELFPNMAKVMDRTTVLRSLTHPYPIHGVAYALTGVPAIDVNMELAPYDSKHWPFFGSVVEYVEGRRNPTLAAGAAVPSNIALPFRFSTKRVGEVPRAGPYAAFLGSQYDPLWADFVGQANKGITKTLRDMTYTDHDPYVGIADGSYFVVPSASSLLDELTLNRLDRRKSLLSQLNQGLPALVHSAAGRALSKHQQSALALLESPKLAEALDLRREPDATRGLYGQSLFGQSCLAARRLVEAGSRVVSVFWDEFGLAGSGWDTHWNHYPRMRQELAPGFDIGWYGLITDLDRRGMLDDVLVVCTSEHGRTPHMNSAVGGGRDHWSRAYSSLIAGAGIARGKIVGATDKHASDVSDKPISPKDLLATMYHLLGIDPHFLIADRQGRPLPLVEGAVIGEALA
ncbi:MAG: DUF1501 domain-containing protein [Planctomycetaceae bacterium]|nr:DUF1501 domain-containing protein [Planctomycetaceae bacterium]